MFLKSGIILTVGIFIYQKVYFACYEFTTPVLQSETNTPFHRCRNGKPDNSLVVKSGSN